MQRFQRAEPIVHPQMIEAALQDPRIASALRDQQRKFDSGESTLWLNETYTVEIDTNPEVAANFFPMIHLSIKRNDRAPIHDWRDLQTIKNMLVGEDHEAVELYPAQSRVIDTSNQYHLWVLKDAGIMFPFGWTSGFIGTPSQAASMGAVQRPFESKSKQRRRLVR